MSPDERQNFEKLLKEDEAFQKTFEEHKSVFNAFKINEAKQLKTTLVAHESKEPSEKRFISKPLIYSIAATFIVLLGMSAYFNFFKQDIYSQYFEPYPNVYQPVVRGDAEESTKAFMYYENRNYIMAQDAFIELLDKDDSPEVRFYLGLSYLNNDQTQEAISEFIKITDIDFEFEAELYWYYALAEIKLGHKENAANLLKQLRSNFPEYKKPALNSILKSL